MKGRIVVVDTATRWLYVGTLAGEDDTHLVLENADAYDISETTLTKHEYLRMIRQDGLVPNRKRVRIFRSQVVAVSLLEDVLVE